MAGGGEGRTLEETSTWAVALVCLVLVAISIIIEHVIHLVGKWLKSHHKWALYEALEKVKSELMLLGFVSLLLTVGQSSIAKICVPAGVADSWHPCTAAEEASIIRHGSSDEPATTRGRRRRRLLSTTADAVGDVVRRGLAGGGGGSSTDKCAAKGKAPFISAQGINQLHIFIFVLAIFHILYCICTMALGRLKMRSWKAWELEAKTPAYQLSHDPSRFRFARETSFGRRHLNFWSKSPVLIWIVCFMRQFGSSVLKVDYLTLRHGFIAAHLAPQSSSKFNFHKYINRSLEQDFKVVVGISPAIWFIALLFLLFNTHGWHSFLWLPFVPLIVIVIVGAKLQVIITKMGIQIMERGEVVRGVPIVQPRDNLFWFNRPSLLLFLIHCILFQNAFQFAFLAWSWYEFGYPSCFHKRIEDIIIRISMGILIQVLCSYVTLPLYALVTQMGSNMKPTIFNKRVADALRKWHHTAKQHLKENRTRSGSTAATPSTSRPGTPSSHRSSPVHLLHYYRGDEVDRRYVACNDNDEDRPLELVTMSSLPSPSTSPRRGHELIDVDCSSSSSRYDKSATLKGLEVVEPEMREMPELREVDADQPDISIDFSFEKAQR